MLSQRLDHGIGVDFVDLWRAIHDPELRPAKLQFGGFEERTHEVSESVRPDHLVFIVVGFLSRDPFLPVLGHPGRVMHRKRRHHPIADAVDRIFAEPTGIARFGTVFDQNELPARVPLNERGRDRRLDLAGIVQQIGDDTRVSGFQAQEHRESIGARRIFDPPHVEAIQAEVMKGAEQTESLPRPCRVVDGQPPLAHDVSVKVCRKLELVVVQPVKIGEQVGGPGQAGRPQGPFVAEYSQAHPALATQ